MHLEDHISETFTLVSSQKMVHKVMERILKDIDQNYYCLNYYDFSVDDKMVLNEEHH